LSEAVDETVAAAGGNNSMEPPKAGPSPAESGLVAAKSQALRSGVTLSLPWNFN
jgi:hypothetical protein